MEVFFMYLRDPFINFFQTEPEKKEMVTETKEAWHVEVDLPGVPKEQMEVSVSGGELTLAAERKRGEGVEKYRKVFRLPDTAKGENIEATSDLGVLRVKIPKTVPSQLQIPIA